MNSSLGAGKQIIVTRTPLRLSFFGGGTDLPSYYSRDYGSVVSTTIDKFIYVTVKRHGSLFNEKYRLNYSESELANSIDDIKNVIAKECLKLVPVDAPLYISTIADLPAFSGLGSSSAFAVGLLKALHAFRGESVSNAQLAEEACRVEIDILKRPIGKQDQYAAAIGGLNYIKFRSNGMVSIEPQSLHLSNFSNIFDNLMMFWTELTRDAGVVLAEQNKNTADRLAELDEMRAQSEKFRELLREGITTPEFGSFLHQGWMLKRTLAKGITNSQLDSWYNAAIAAGAYGGKLCGAGGGGFLLFVVATDKKQKVRDALKGLSEVKVNYESQGSQLLFSQ